MQCENVKPRLAKTLLSPVAVKIPHMIITTACGICVLPVVLVWGEAEVPELVGEGVAQNTLPRGLLAHRAEFRFLNQHADP